MADNKVKVSVDLDFTADKMSIEKIKDQMDLAFKAMKINLDPASYKKAESQLKELHRIANLSLNKNSGKINLKTMDTAIGNSSEIASVELLNKSLLAAGVNGSKSFKEIANANQYLQKGLTDSNSLLSKMGTTLSNTIRWNISASAVNAVTGELQRAYGFAKDLDRSLTDIRIVSGLSADSMERFSLAANKAAQELKVSTIDYANASLVFFQQGLNAIEVQNMTRAAIIGGNITGESTEEMSNLLTSVANGYKIATTDILSVTDKLAAVGASTAADFYELATAMSKVASMANAAGVPIDELNAQIATIVSVTKESPESIGTSLKTIYGRMLAFKADTKAIMKDEDGESFGAPNVEAALQAYNRATGAQISLFKITKDGKKELRELGDVINEIGGSWEKTSDNVAKFGLTTALAGSRQQNRLISLFDAWDEYKDTVEVSLNAEGTSLKQNEIYMESYQGRLKGLQAAKEELYMVFTNTNGLKDFISGLTSALGLISKISEAAGGLSAVLGVVGSALASSAVPKIYANKSKYTDILPKTNDTSIKDEQIKITKELNAIEKVYGAEVANTHRLKIKAAAEEAFVNKKTTEELHKQLNIFEEIKNIETSEESAQKRNSQLAAVTKEVALNKEALASIENMKKSYRELRNETAKLDSLNKMPPTPKISKEIEETKQNIDKLKVSIDEVNDALEETYETSSRTSEITTGVDKHVKKEAEDIATEAEKIHRTTLGIQSAMMLLPAVIGTAKDSTKSWTDVLLSAGTMTATMLPTIIGEATKIAPKLKDAGGAAAALKVFLGSSLGPLSLIIAGVTILGVLINFAAKSANKLKDTLAEMDEFKSNIEQAKAGYEGIESELKAIEDRMKEISKIGGEQTDETKEELALLTTKKGQLEEEKILQGFLVNAEKEKLALASATALKATKKSEFAMDSGALNGNDRPQAKDVTVAEELKLATAEYERSTAAIEANKAALITLGEETPKNAKERKNLQKSIEEENEARSKSRDSMASQLVAAKDIIAGIGEITEENKENYYTLLNQSDATTELMTKEIQSANVKDNLTDATNGNTMANEQNNTSKEEQDKITQELIDKYEEVTGKIQTYNGFLSELNSTEGLSVQSKQDIITKHAELLPYISDEQELRKQLTLIIAEEEKVQKRAYMNMILDSETFYNAKILGNATLVKELSEKYEIDFKNFKSLADAKAQIETKLINGLSGMWSAYYRSVVRGNTATETVLEDRIMKGIGDVGKANQTLNAAQAVIGMATQFDDIALNLGGVNFKDINLSKVKSGSKGGSSGGSSSSKTDTPAYLETLDAEIRAIKIKNDHLLVSGDLLKEQLEAAKDIEGIEGLNEQYRITGEIIANNDLLLQSFKQEQDLIHKRAEELRLQNSKYNTLNWFDANAEQSIEYIELHRKGTKAQQDEMDILFGKIQKLKQAWMESANEVDGIVDSTKDLVAAQDDLLKKQREMKRVAYIEELNRAYEEQQDALADIATIQDRIVDIIRKRGEAEKEALSVAHTAEMESLQERYDKRKEGYAKELTDFQKMIQGKLDALEDQNTEEDYLKNLQKERDKATELQKQIDVLSLDTSLTAKNKVIDLRKQLATQNESIADIQQERERTLIRESLEDQLTDFEESVKDKEEIADEVYNNEVKRLEEDYEINQKYLEQKYSDAKIYSEARQALIDGEVEVSKGHFVTLKKAFKDFEDEFGKGMGMLGDIIKDDFNDKLIDAQRLIEETANLSKKLLTKTDPDADFDDDELGVEKPTKPPKNDSGSDTGKGIYMNLTDFSNHRMYKFLYNLAKNAGDKAGMKKQHDEAQAIRDKYKIQGDKYTYEDLVGKHYSQVAFKSGGETNRTGMHWLDGEDDKPERVLSAQQTKDFNTLVERMPSLLKMFDSNKIQDLIKNSISSPVNFILPNIPALGSTGNGGNQYNIKFEVQGNMDRSLLPEVEQMIKRGIDSAQDQKISKYKDIGIKRPVR